MHGSEFPGTGHVKDLIAAWESRVPSLKTPEMAQGADIPENQSPTISMYPDMESGDTPRQPLKRGQKWMETARGLKAYFVLDQC